MQRWQNQAEKRLFIGSNDWQHPVALALIETILRDNDLQDVLHRFSIVRDKAGFSFEEMITDLQCLVEVLPGDIRPRLDRLDTITPLGMQASRFVDMETITACIDPLTDLPKEAYLRARIREIFRQGRALGVSVVDNYILVIIHLGNRHTPTIDSKNWNISVAREIKYTFNQGETVATLHRGIYVCITEKSPEITYKLSSLRSRLHQLTEKNMSSGMETLDSYYPHIWQEELGETPQATFQIFSDLLS